MYLAKYLLSTQELTGDSALDPCQEISHACEEALFSRAFLGVDDTRRKKAQSLKTVKGRAACLGAGLLLQLAVGEALGISIVDDRTSRWLAGFTNDLKCYSVGELLCRLQKQPRLQLSYRYGENGKPYFRDLPFCFNLSHSGEYVLCALSTTEIGVDIQQRRGKNEAKLARRFFSEREIMALEQAGTDGRELFYRLWARKEAYGKLTGRGVLDALEIDLLPGKDVSTENRSSSDKGQASPKSVSDSPGVWMSETCTSLKGTLGDGRKWTNETTFMPDGNRLLWEEYDGIEGYSIALCRYGESGYFS